MAGVVEVLCDQHRLCAVDGSKWLAGLGEERLRLAVRDDAIDRTAAERRERESADFTPWIGRWRLDEYAIVLRKA